MVAKWQRDPWEWLTTSAVPYQPIDGSPTMPGFPDATPGVRKHVAALRIGSTRIARKLIPRKSFDPTVLPVETVLEIRDGSKAESLFYSYYRRNVDGWILLYELSGPVFDIDRCLYDAAVRNDNTARERHLREYFK